MINMSNEINELAAALSKFQSGLANPKAEAKNAFFNSKYTTLDELTTHIKPALEACSLSYFQSIEGDGENISVATRVIHSSGQWLETGILTLKNQDQKGVNTNQAAGISITYARRYSLAAALGLTSDNDTDGNNSSQQGYKAPKGNKKNNSSNGTKKTNKSSSGTTEDHKCEDCGTPIKENVYTYSTHKLGGAYCLNCQPKHQK